jgi:MFS family permease
MMGGAAAVQATGSEMALLLAMPIVGLGFGVLQPTVTTMIGHEAPGHLKATIFGLSGGASSLGIAAGPFLAGMAASVVGVWSGQLVAAAAAATAVGLILGLAREPLADGQVRHQVR